MIKEFVEIFCIGYLYSSIFLLPFYGFYFVIDPARFSPSYMHRLHKWVLVITMIVPLFFTILTFSPGPKKAGRIDMQPQSIPSMGVEIKRLPEKAIEDNMNNPSPGYIDAIENYHQAALGMFYYLVDFLTGLIMAGFIVFLARLFVQRRYLNYIERGSLKRIDHKGYRIIVSSRITSPFSTGLRCQNVYLPGGLARDERNIIIKHEQHHFQKHHHYWSLLESLIIHLFWFNPVSHLMRKRGVLYREMECDTDTIRTIDKYHYSRVLLNSAESMLPSGRLGPMGQQWIQKSALKVRLENILNEKKGKRRLITYGFFLVLMLSAGVFFFISLLDNDTQENNLVKKAETEYSKILKTRDGITIKEVPDHLIKVLIFNEDKGFYDHDGVSAKAFLRAMLSNLSGGPLQGGSTISQQLSRILCIQTSERTLGRKLKQIKAARVLEKHFTKDQILEMYINSVYFGQGAYGIDMAAKTFFNHSASELIVAESAMLIQSLGKPKYHNYLANPEVVEKRTLQLLNRMVDHGLLDQKTVEKSMATLKKNLGMNT